MRKLIVAAVGVAATMGVTGGTAFAAPTNSPRANQFTLVCSDGTFGAVAPGGGNSMQSKSVTPAHITSGGSGILVPTTITFSFPFGSFTTTRGQGNPNANAVNCTTTLSNGATITASGFKTP